MNDEWGEPLTEAQIRAETDRIRAREATKQSRHTMWSVIAGIVAAATVVLGIVGAVLQSNLSNTQKEREKAVACVAAGNAWVENSSGSFECRKA